MLTDTHCHLDMIADNKIVLLRAKEAGVGTIINVGTSIDASRESIEIAEGTDLVDVYATCGIHAQEGPKDIKKYGEYSSSDSEKFSLRPAKGGASSNNKGLNACIDELRKIAQSSKKVVGIGECGMDYFPEATKGGPATGENDKKAQRGLFEAQVKLAIDLDLPLIIHCRNAWDETFEIIEKYSSSGSEKFSLRPAKGGASSNNTRPDSGVASLPRMTGGLRGLFHSWTGTVEQAKKALSLGFYISFSGIVTFKNAGEIPQVAKMVPDDRILMETDAPFLTPRRGSPSLKFQGASKQNEPKNVRITAQFVADLRGVSLDEISDITTENANKLFGLHD